MSNSRTPAPYTDKGASQVESTECYYTSLAIVGICVMTAGSFYAFSTLIDHWTTYLVKGLAAIYLLAAVSRTLRVIVHIIKDFR